MVADGDRPTVLSVQKYESGPPVAHSPDGQLVSSDGDTLAATKQEEWVKKKRVELTTTKQIETRVKRQIVLEDGKVVDDSGPIVTTNTTEDTDKQESEHTEHFTHGDDMGGKEGWVAVESVPEDAVVKETNEKKITTHDEVEDIYETEEIQHLGDVSNEGIVRALREEQDMRKGLLSSSEKRDLLPYYSNKEPQKRVLKQTMRHDRITDIEDTKEISKMKDNGNMVTEITRRHEHEEFHNDDIPDSESDEFEHIENQEGEQDYSHAKSENFIDYIAVPQGGKSSRGIKIGEGARLVSENISSQRQGDDDIWDSVSDRVRRIPKPETLYSNKFGAIPQTRPNVLTNRPLDMGHEEYTKRHETTRWLNSHFGSSSSSLNSETSPRSPLAATPTGIHVTMTSRSSPLNSPPPAPPMPAGKYANLSQNTRSTSAKFLSKLDKEPVGKRISFGDTPSRAAQNQHTVHFDLKNRHEEVMRSLNSPSGRVSVTKSGSPWDEVPTPTPPPRYRRTKSPDRRADSFSPIDQTHIRHTGTMNNHSSRNHISDYTSSYLQKREDVGERKSYERREQNFGYNGPTAANQALTRDSLESGNFGNSGYVSKQSNYYKTNETDNPGQNSVYENGEAEVEQRKTVERRERVFSYDGPPQKQFHPKYIVGNPSSTMGRLKGIEHTGAVIEPSPNSRSQTLPRRRFYFGDDQGSLSGLEGKRSSTKAIKFGTDDINVSISNSYQNANDHRKSHSLSRSMSFTPRSMGREKPTFTSSRLSQGHKHSPTYTSNPQLLDSPDLLAPKLLQNMSRSVRDINSLSNERNEEFNYSNRHESSNASRSKRTFLDNIKKHSTDFYDSAIRSSKASSPARSVNSPTNAYSPLRSADNTRALARKTLNSPRTFGGANSPISDDYHETYRMSSSTPDREEGKPRISTDTTSRFSRRTLRSDTGQPAGQVESSQTTTRTKSRYKESEVMYPNGRRVASPANFQIDYQPRQLNSGTVVIPVRDSNNNKDGHFRK